MAESLPSLSDPAYIRGQYQKATNLNARIRLHQLFSTNPYGWQRWVFDQLPLSPGGQILELGCGAGDLWRENIDRLPPGLQILLSDLFEGMLEQTRHNLDAYAQRFEFRAIDAQSIPLEDQRFDVVIANHMLFHLPDRPKGLTEMRRVLKPDGVLIATTIGESSQKELSSLVGRFDLQLSSWGKLPSDSFTLENGADQLKPYFGRVELFRYEDALLVTELEPLIDYLLSGRLELSPDRQAELIEFVRQEFEAMGGKIYISKDAGLFLAKVLR